MRLTKRIGEGDFRIQARLSLARLKGTAASFSIADGQFGFDGREGVLFVQGELFAGTTKSIGKTEGLLKAGDFCLIWKEQRYDATLIEPICQAAIERLRWPSEVYPGVLLFSNPASTAGRVRMTLHASFDDGKT